ncbi:MAG: BTAD domain-containing putative transcriptional regulator, partial [Ilumatobacteraceae bacterium]
MARLDDRWTSRLVTVVAGAGFGKTSLLVDAITSNVAASGSVSRASLCVRRDVWLTCEPADTSAASLLRGLRAACDLRPQGTLASLCAWVWSQAPDEVCFVLDDVHEIEPRSSGMDLIRQLQVELPLNGHLVAASREPVAVPAARLAAHGQLVRISEAELLFDDGELDEFARSRGITADLCASSGGWPALAELLANAGEDLVFDYLWEEVLARVGRRRAECIALFHAVGGGDDDIALAISDGELTVRPLLAGLPLVARTGGHGAVLHPLWGPPLRDVAAAQAVDQARLRAADVHRRGGRSTRAIELQLDAEAWDEAMATMREVALDRAFSAAPDDFGRWYSALPARRRSDPVARLAAGLDERSRDPVRSSASFAAAAAGFATIGDVDGETATIAHEGIVRWWANDVVGILTLLGRVQELADRGSAPAIALMSVGTAAVAQVVGDAPGVLAALRNVDARISPSWLPAVRWLRSVAHRQRGDLAASYAELDLVGAESDVDAERNQFDLARWRTDWLAGDVERVCQSLGRLADRYRVSGELFFYVQVMSERAAHEAWLGRSTEAVALLDSTNDDAAALPGSLQHVLRTIARAAVAIERGDESAATSIIAAEASTTLRGPDRWYWRDRAALALECVLLDAPPATDDPAGAAHVHGVHLAASLRAARRGDHSLISSLQWPQAGVVRAQLPHRWMVELCAAGVAAGNPPPQELIERFGPEVREVAARLASSATDPRTRSAASSAHAAMPAAPARPLTISLLGPLELRLGDVIVDHPHLRRRRVRQLLSTLVVRRQLRREVLAAYLWPDHPAPAHNLRVTLAYLQQLLQPHRPAVAPPYFVRSDGEWLRLVDTDLISVDLWELERHLDAGERADRDGDPAQTIEHITAALPLWRGDPLDELPDTDWAMAERARLVSRYADAAVRAGELQLAAGKPAEASRSAGHAVVADPCNEAAHQLMIRSRLVSGDRAGARRALADCAAALATLDLRPDASTLML